MSTAAVQSFSVYQATVPMLLRSLSNLSGVIDKTEAFCKAGNSTEKEVLSYRLRDDMRPFPYQVQGCSDMCKALIARIHNKPPISIEDNEETFDQLRQRIQTTIDILKSVKPDDIDSAPLTREVEWKSGMGTFYFSVEDYIFQWIVPNFYFHMSTAYCIARSLGVPLSVLDFVDSDRTLFVKTPLEQRAKQ